MNRQEAIEYIQEWLKDKYALNGKDRIVLNMAMEALTDVVNEDGTLTIHVSDGSKVGRVLVLGDNHCGGLYYADDDDN